MTELLNIKALSKPPHTHTQNKVGKQLNDLNNAWWIKMLLKGHVTSLLVTTHTQISATSRANSRHVPFFSLWRLLNDYFCPWTGCDDRRTLKPLPWCGAPNKVMHNCQKHRDYGCSEEDLEDTLLYFTLTERERETGYFGISGIKGVQFELPASFQRKRQTE